MPDLQRFALNAAGRDFVVGDIHGFFGALQDAMASVGFDHSVDRLFSVGDLGDRGPDSADAIVWMGKPWFHPVKGNHEAMACQYFVEPIPEVKRWFVSNGGQWFVDLPFELQRAIATAFVHLPLAIEIETKNGLVGIVHAEVPGDDWACWDEVSTAQTERIALWSRDRINHQECGVVKGVYRVYVGHTPLREVQQLGNVRYIDTGAVFGGKLTIEQIGT